MEELKQFLDSIHPTRQDTWNRLKPLFKPGHLAKGDFFIREGEVENRFAFVESGIIRAFYTNAEGKEYTKHFFTTPSIVGSYASLITGKPSLFSQQALTACRLWSADYAQLMALYDSLPELERLGRKFAEKYFVANEAKDVERNVQNADVRYENFKKQFPGVDQEIPQYYIASYLGITPTQLSRIRSKSR